MRRSTLFSGVGLTLIQGFVELLLFLPLLLVVSALVTPELPLWQWAGGLPLCYAAGYAINRRFTFHRFYSLLIGTLWIGAAYALIVFQLSLHTFWLLPLSWLLVYRGAKLVEVPWRLYFSTTYYIVGMLLYFISSIVFSFYAIFQPYVSLLNGSGLLALVITLVRANQANVQVETLSGDKEPVVASPVLWNNRLLTGLFILIIVAIVLFRKLQQAFLWLKTQLIYLIQWLLNRPTDSVDQEPAANPPAPPPMLPDKGEPSAWLQWLEKIAYYAVGALLAVALLFLLYKISGKLAALLAKCYRWLIAWMTRTAERKQDTGYEDDVEHLISWRSWNDALADRWKNWREARSERHTRWEDLADNRERIRFLYRELVRGAMKEGYRFKPDFTPRETVRDLKTWRQSESDSDKQERLAGLYDKARYSHKQVTDTEVSDIAEAVLNKKKRSP